MDTNNNEATICDIQNSFTENETRIDNKKNKIMATDRENHENEIIANISVNTKQKKTVASHRKIRR